jgi:SRSO17 transposase
MLKVTRLPAEMQEFFAVAGDGLNLCQKAHLVVYIIGLLLGAGRGNVAALTRLRTDGRHRTALTHFLTHSPWDGFDMLQRVTLWQLEQLRKQPGDPSDPDRDTIFPTIDDTKQEKPGKKMAGRRRIYDSSNKRYLDGTDAVQVTLRFRGRVFPWASKLVLTEEQAAVAGRPHQTCVEIGAELLASFTAPSGLLVRVLFDTAYLAEAVVDVVTAKGWKLVSRAKPDRVVVPDRGRPKADGKNQHVGQYMRNCLRRGSRHVTIGEGKLSRRCQVTDREASLQGVGRVTLVFSILVRVGKKWVSHPPIAIVTTDLEAAVETILRYLAYRWSIEEFFKVVKQHLGWSQYQTRSLVGAERHLCLVSLAHSLLTHLRIKQEGAVARRQTARRPASAGENFHDPIRRLVGAEAIRQARTRGLDWLEELLGFKGALA